MSSNTVAVAYICMVGVVLVAMFGSFATGNIVKALRDDPACTSTLYKSQDRIEVGE